jgi:hypothetical protein
MTSTLEENGLYFFIGKLCGKTFPEGLKNVMSSVVEMVNYIKSRALNTRFLKVTCQEAGALQYSLVFHTKFAGCQEARYSPDFMN